MISHIRISAPLRTMPAWSSLTFTLVALLTASFLLVSPAHAAGVVGNGTPESCTEATLTAALAGGGTVTFNCGNGKSFTFTNEKVITQDTVIQGGNTVTFNGGSVTRLFRVTASARLTLNDLRLQNGLMSAGCGGAIYNLGTVIILNTLFEKNIAADGGGAICTAPFGAPSVQITNSTFLSNGAAQAGTGVGYGGAIFLNSTGTLTVTGAVFRENKAQFGGALAILPGATATIRDKMVGSETFSQNSATHSGGAIYNLGSLNLYNTRIGNNSIPSNITVNGYGGGVASLGALTIHNSLFYFNQGLTGGGLYLTGGLDSSVVHLQQVKIESNRAKHSGGGIFADNTTLTITNTTFTNNEAGGSGGGLACAQCARLRLSNSAFVTNTAAYGGGLYVSAAAAPGSARVESTTFSRNQALTSRGGGVYNQGYLQLYFSTIAYNSNGVHNLGNAITSFRSTVLHNPGYTNCGSEGQMQFNNNGANHVSDNSCGPQFTAAGDPQLGPLQFELQQQYWSTAFHLPLAGSPLINTGSGSCPERDQRGRLRPDACDIGAVEFGGRLPVPPPSPAGSPVYLPIIIR